MKKIMNKQIFNKLLLPLLSLLVLYSCTSARFMNNEEYNRIALGEAISEVQVQMGRPYEVRELGPGEQEYVYIERIPLGNGREAFRRYIFVVDNERIIEKKVKEEVSSPVQFVWP